MFRFFYSKMEQISSNLKKGEITLKIQNKEDLWYLNTIIGEGDYVRGKTVRKIKNTAEDERNSKATKKVVYIKLMVEKLQFNNLQDTLRISGKVVEGPEEISRGSYHTFSVGDNDVITVIKERWYEYQLKKLREAMEKEVPPILICCHDREEAYFAILKRQGYQLLRKITGAVAKKAEVTVKKQNFYKEITQSLQDFDKRYHLSQIIVASPAFWKEELIKHITDKEMKDKIIPATCSSVDKNGIVEVLHRPELKTALKKDRVSHEMKLVEEVLSLINKEGPVVYGLQETLPAGEAGAIDRLIITDTFIKDMREKEAYQKIDILLQTVEKNKGTINFISSDHEGGKKLDGIGGIAAVLRYKVG